MAEQQEDKKFIDFVVRHLVDNPENVQVNRTVDEMGVLITLDVHEDDMGKVIGRNGNTAKALRTLLRTVGMKNDARVNLKIREPEERDEPIESASDDDADDAMDELSA